MDLSEYSEEAVSYIHHRFRLMDVTVADFSEALGIQRTTWYAWKAGALHRLKRRGSESSESPEGSG